MKKRIRCGKCSFEFDVPDWMQRAECPKCGFSGGLCPWPDCDCSRIWGSTKRKTIEDPECPVLEKRIRVTRCCERQIVIVNGGYYRSFSESPEWRILKFYEKMMNEFGPTEWRDSYVIEYGDDSYQAFVGKAGFMLDRCDGDLGWVIEAIRVAFMDRDNFGWIWNEGRKTGHFFILAGKKVFPDLQQVSKKSRDKHRAYIDEQAREYAAREVDDVARRKARERNKSI